MKICKTCRGVYNGRRWTYNNDIYEKIKNKKDTKNVLCLACERLRDKIVCGILNLEGEILQSRHEEIRNFIKNESEKALKNNYMSRILSVDDKGDKITIYSIDAPLALYLGRKFKRIFHGHLHIQQTGEQINRKGDRQRSEDVIVTWKE